MAVAIIRNTSPKNCLLDEGREALLPD